MRKDVLIVVVSLALIALVGIVGLVVLSYAAKPVDSSLIALIATAVGALASLLARTTGSSEAPPAPPAVNVASKVPPLAALVLVAFGLAGSTGCAWFSRANHAKDIASILACISGEAAAGKSATDIALTCGLENADAVIDLVTKSQGVASAAPKMAKPAGSVKP